MKKLILGVLLVCCVVQVQAANKESSAGTTLDAIATKLANRIESDDMKQLTAEFLGAQVASLSLTQTEKNEFKKFVANMHEYLNMDSKEIRMLRDGNKEEIEDRIYEAQKPIFDKMIPLRVTLNQKLNNNRAYQLLKKDENKNEANERMLAEKRKIPEFVQLEQLQKEADSIEAQMKQGIIAAKSSDQRVKRWEYLDAQFSQFSKSLADALTRGNSARGVEFFKSYSNVILENIQKHLDASK